MRPVLKSLGRLILMGVIWVYILSIQIGGRPLFEPMSDLLVHNPLVHALDRELEDLAMRLRRATKVALSDPSQPMEAVKTQ